VYCAGYWDDWLREPAQRKGRTILHPEVPRTKTYGKVGVSQAQFFDAYLGTIYLNDRPVDFQREDLSYLQPTTYDAKFLGAVKNARVVTLDALLRIKELANNYSPTTNFNAAQLGLCDDSRSSCLRLDYHGLGEHSPIPPTCMYFAKRLGIMADVKANIFRTAYLGVVTFRYKGYVLFLADPSNMK
jgi:alpha-1,3-mannosyl-glycoprotein beta-1,2-N-acetylglucosaminyltransferase